MSEHKTEAQFRAESDVHTLTQAAAIEADMTRMLKARTAAKGMAKEEAVKAKATQRIASSTPRQKRADARKKRS